MTTVDQSVVPPEVAARVLDGHALGAVRPPAGTTAQRWSCGRCGDVAVAARGEVFGDATERTCSESQRYQGGARWER